ncbi:MAG: hypothetical protein QOE73_973, partial [Verrucomicrobiota bacterium]
MLIRLFFVTLLAVTASAFIPFASAEDANVGGIVYGPKAAFNITAPDGWVLDNHAGTDQGLPCVLYPKGS